MGQRGPKQGAGGRPKKSISDKIADGNREKRTLTVINFQDNTADIEGRAMPKTSEYLLTKQADGSTLCAADRYEKHMAVAIGKRLWSEIYQIVRKNCTGEYTGNNPQDDVMERLLCARKGKQ